MTCIRLFIVENHLLRATSAIYPKAGIVLIIVENTGIKQNGYQLNSISKNVHTCTCNYNPQARDDHQIAGQFQPSENPYTCNCASAHANYLGIDFILQLRQHFMTLLVQTTCSQVSELEMHRKGIRDRVRPEL